MKRYVAIILLRVVVQPVHRDACVKRARHRKRVFIESNMRVVLPIAFIERTGAFTCFAANFFMIFNTTDWGPILGAVFFAFGTCVCTVGPSVMMTKEFGRLDIGKATSIMVAVQSVGGIMGAIVSGQAFDAALSFTPAWIFGMVISVIMGVCMVASVKLARKLVAKQIAAGAPRVDEEGKIVEGSVATA